MQKKTLYIVVICFSILFLISGGTLFYISYKNAQKCSESTNTDTDKIRIVDLIGSFDLSDSANEEEDEQETDYSCPSSVILGSEYKVTQNTLNEENAIYLDPGQQIYIENNKLLLLVFYTNEDMEISLCKYTIIDNLSETELVNKSFSVEDILRFLPNMNLLVLNDLDYPYFYNIKEDTIYEPILPDTSTGQWNYKIEENYGDGEYLHIAYLPVVSFGCESDTSDEYCNQMAEEDKEFKIENDIHILRSDGESQTLNLTESNYSADVLFNFRNYESYLYLLYTSGNEDIIKEYNLEELFN